ncbi:MAG: Octanoate-[acyl-carrier-protein]-protein-N-octanoyltransferase [uncultured Friedmanniella sp.]|uniref:Octanoyltransferase n=1 Tax=uncultured Friedmanniella sp. TaxID=335381 RepID=A0A6J4LDJ1_9ACTN|nr:lipoyl(octanoyl) transferase LipB [uncultured Friedmanniella sp.]CAA9329227.1 MAG: Octanoate-[acyl-carrier-protein]-protein-N-octanoyltransferase [uncultured Friedmanniella sp.]
MSLDFLYPGLGSELVDYTSAWELQRQLHAQVSSGAAPDTVLVLEHAEVYTAGKRTEPHERPTSGGVPVVEVDRGGKITWHGPGQLVVYPIVRLPESVGVVDYVRRLEEAMIGLFTEYGLTTGRVRGRSGVWLAADPPTAATARPERKIAAIGVRVAGGTTMHGLAINVHPDLAGFGRIVPCGLSDVGVTSMAAELGEAPTLPEVAHLLRPHLERMLAFEPYQQSPDLAAGSPVTYGLTVGAA